MKEPKKTGIHVACAFVQHLIPGDLICTEPLLPVPPSDSNKLPAEFPFSTLLLASFFPSPGGSRSSELQSSGSATRTEKDAHARTYVVAAAKWQRTKPAAPRGHNPAVQMDVKSRRRGKWLDFSGSPGSLRWQRTQIKKAICARAGQLTGLDYSGSV